MQVYDQQRMATSVSERRTTRYAKRITLPSSIALLSELRLRYRAAPYHRRDTSNIKPDSSESPLKLCGSSKRSTCACSKAALIAYDPCACQSAIFA